MTSVTVVVPMTIRRRGGRKQIIGPDGAPVLARQDGPGVETTSGDPTLVKALARAFRWRRMLEEGRCASIRELAATEGIDRSYVGRLLKLTLLASATVEAVLDGQVEPDATLAKLIGVRTTTGGDAHPAPNADLPKQASCPLRLRPTTG